MPWPDLVEAGPSVAHLGFRHATDDVMNGKAAKVFIRPTCVHDGGETLTSAGDDTKEVE